MNKSYNEDFALLNSIKKGNLEAFIQIVRIHQNLVNRLAFSLVGNRQMANELVILTYLDLWNKRKAISSSLPLSVYFANALHRVARANPNIFQLTPLQAVDGPYGWLLREEIRGFINA